ncbi:glycerophosphodiester phosphodiesterase [Marinilabiliaceae bacterium JC017]|nr:glycerophosphodiester phosphodiesterase [Marinilabiliaceae bacterium JC017]
MMRKIVYGWMIMMGIVSSVQAQEYIGHRGASYLAPENTVASAKLAWELGADAIEIDVHLSSDHRVMVHHDHSTKRQTGVDLEISKTSSAELRKLDAGSFKGEQYKGEKIPFLEEVIETIPEGKTLVVEIKCSNEVLPYLKEIVNASGKKDQIAFISFGWETILATKEMFPENKCYWLSSVVSKINSRMEEAKQHGLDGLDLNYGAINKELMKRATKMGFEVLCWTVDDPQVATRLGAMGVSGFTTNRPGWLKSAVDAE